MISAWKILVTVACAAAIALSGCESKSPAPETKAGKAASAPAAVSGGSAAPAGPVIAAVKGADALVEPVSGAGRVLIDSIHAHNYIEQGLEPGVYAYHQTAGLHTAVGYLRARGIGFDEIKSGTLEPAILGKYKILLINLVSAEMPPFTVREIAAVKSFIEGGGSLLAVVDHSNCYFHAHVLGPMMDELGIELHKETVCENPPRSLGFGNAWITVQTFKPHPVTEGLHCIAMQTGGTVDDRFAIATTTETGYGDAWVAHPYFENDSPGFFGNYKLDPGERTGKLGVVLAKELGKGKIVVIGDQNMLGDNFIRFGDNYKLWMNSVAWLMDDGGPATASAATSIRRADVFQNWKGPRILLYEDYDHAAFGSAEPSKFYNFFSYVLRSRWAFATDDLSIGGELLVIPSDQTVMPAAAIDAVVAHLRGGRHVILLQSEGFALLAGDGLMGQLTAKLGKPTTMETPKTTLIAYPQVTGRVALMRDSAMLTNEKMAKPTVEPEPGQKRLEGLVDTAIDAFLPGGSMDKTLAAPPPAPAPVETKTP